VILEIVSGALSIGESSPPGSGIPAALIVEMRRANRDGFGHCALTCLFAIAGVLAFGAMARR
jgi:hypothetical protein